MNPDLVCKIVVHTSDQKTYRGSGYPITPNRIITAAHVVADAAHKETATGEEAARQITLTFGVKERPVDTPVFIEWCGTAHEVDVAVLRCQLPPDVQPAHELLSTPPGTPIEWHAQGYTDFAKGKRPGGKDAYNGTLQQFSSAEPTVALGCQTGPITSEQWAGGSGSVVFDTSIPRTALAVITDYQGGKKLDQLVAVPLCYLLNTEETRDEFRRAIQFDAYQKRQEYRDEVIHTVATTLSECGEKILKRIAQKIDAKMSKGTSGINLKNNSEEIANATATCMVSRMAATEVIGCLAGLMYDLEGEVADKVDDIIDRVLPLTYAPGVVQRLYEQLAAHQVGLVENEVATRILAEIIMAGYDQKLAQFAEPTSGDHDLRGKIALDYPDGPEEGFELAQGNLDVLRMVSNFLRDLLALRHTIGGGHDNRASRVMAGVPDEAELLHTISDYATRLSGALQFISDIHDGRTVYCVLKLPEHGLQRDFYKQVLGVIRTHVPQLIFVELSKRAREAREFAVAEYYQTRVIRTQRMQKP